LFAAVLQAYETRVGDGFVMAGNEALVVCSLPAHTAQFLQVAAWITSEGVEISPSAAAPGQDTTRMRSIVDHYFLLHFQVCKGVRWPETRWQKYCDFLLAKFLTLILFSHYSVVCANTGG
jgi:hypothetical protein